MPAGNTRTKASVRESNPDNWSHCEPIERGLRQSLALVCPLPLPKEKRAPQ